MNKIEDIIEMSKKHTGESKQIDLELTVIEDKKIYNIYSAIIGYRDICFLADRGCLSYVVDTVGFNDYLCLTHIEE